MSDQTLAGSCLCGVVGYRITGPFQLFQYCHCSRCRKFTGSAHSSNLFVSPDKFSWTSGESQVGRYEHPEAKHLATCFCKICGSSLPWANQANTVIIVPAGTLDDVPDIRPQQNIYWDSHAGWYVDVSSLPKYAELPVKNHKA